MTESTFTPEEIAKKYAVSLDSVDLINSLVAVDSLNELQIDKLRRHTDHLEYTVTRDFWTDEDLTPFSNAATAGRAKITSYDSE